MKQDYPRLIPIWLLFLIMALILLLMSSCRGGRSISGNSTGITVISPSNLERQANGTYRLRPAPPKITQPKEIKTAPQKPVTPTPVKVKSTPVPPVSLVKPESLIPPLPKNDPLPLATPSVTLIPIPPETVNVLPTLPEEESEEVDKSSPDKKAVVSVKWPMLILYYLIVIVLTAGIYIIYKNHKIKSKKRVRKPRKKKS